MRIGQCTRIEMDILGKLPISLMHSLVFNDLDFHSVEIDVYRVQESSATGKGITLVLVRLR